MSHNFISATPTTCPYSGVSKLADKRLQLNVSKLLLQLLLDHLRTLVL